MLHPRRHRKNFVFTIVKYMTAAGLLYYAMQHRQFWSPHTRDFGMLIIITIALMFVFLSVSKCMYLMQKQKENRIYLGSDIRHVDTLSGIEFERYLRAHFKSKGYRVFLTPPQHDYGVDLVITKGGDKIAVQAKRYNYEQGYKVTYKAVQEVSAGKAYYGCNKGIVITNSFFTRSARELAECNNIDMWDRNRLIEEFRIAGAPKPQAYKDGYYPGTVKGTT